MWRVASRISVAATGLVLAFSGLVGLVLLVDGSSDRSAIRPDVLREGLAQHAALIEVEKPLAGASRHHGPRYQHKDTDPVGAVDPGPVLEHVTLRDRCRRHQTAVLDEIGA